MASAVLVPRSETLVDVQDIAEEGYALVSFDSRDLRRHVEQVEQDLSAALTRLQAPVVIVDFAGLTALPSLLLSVVVRFHDQAVATGKTLHFCCPEKSTLVVLKALGLPVPVHKDLVGVLTELRRGARGAVRSAKAKGRGRRRSADRVSRRRAAAFNLRKSRGLAAGLAAVILLFGARLAWPAGGGADERDRAVRQGIRDIPHAYVPASGGALVLKMGPQEVPVDGADGECLWEAFVCLDPKCPARRDSGEPHRFAHVLPEVVDEDGNSLYDETTPCVCPSCVAAGRAGEQVARYWTEEARAMLDRLRESCAAVAGP